MLSLYLSILDNSEDQNKFTQLYNEYQEPMFYAANKILKNIHSAEDAVHDAFLRVIKNLHKIPDIYCPQTKNYLVIIVRNVALSMINPKVNQEVFIADDDSFWEIDSGFNLEDDNLSKLNVEKMVEKIKKLPIIYKDAIYLDCVMNMNINEIAEMLSIKKETAKKRIQRGKILLIKSLEKEAIFYE